MSLENKQIIQFLSYDDHFLPREPLLFSVTSVAVILHKVLVIQTKYKTLQWTTFIAKLLVLKTSSTCTKKCNRPCFCVCTWTCNHRIRLSQVLDKIFSFALLAVSTMSRDLLLIGVAIIGVIVCVQRPLHPGQACGSSRSVPPQICFETLVYSGCPQSPRNEPFPMKTKPFWNNTCLLYWSAASN